MKFYVKYMVSARSKRAVILELKKLGITCSNIDTGEVEINEDITIGQLYQIKKALLKAGFELLYDRKTILVDKMKIIIIEMVNQSSEIPKTKISSYLSDKLNHDYTYLANLFSEVTGNTVEQFIIHQKIERVKELLLFNELNLTQISYKMNYSSVAHLSNQFKKVTGLTPSYFRQLMLSTTVV